LGRLLGALAIVLGTAVVGFDPNRLDRVVLDLPRGSHGVHLHDLIGAGLVALGIAVLWYSPSRFREAD